MFDRIHTGLVLALVAFAAGCILLGAVTAGVIVNLGASYDNQQEIAELQEDIQELRAELAEVKAAQAARQDESGGLLDLILMGMGADSGYFDELE